MRRFKLLALLGVMFVLVFPARAAWYWPFDFDPDSTNKPPRLHRLLEKANEYIEIAEDEALEGNGDKAIENYRLALGELDRVEEEYPDRAESPEFAPLRNKRATCSAAIDSIRFAQVNENERAVSVTNTRELERKWRKKHDKMTPEDLAAEKKAAEEEEEKKKNTEEKAKTEEEKDGGKKAEESSEDGRTAAEAKPAEGKKAERETAEEVPAVGMKPVENEKPVAEPGASRDGLRRLKEDLDGKAVVVSPQADRAFQAGLRDALAKLRAGDFAAADVILEKLVAERPLDLNALLMRAASQSGVGSNFAARRTLEKAMRAHPKSYKPYYSLAGIALKLGEGIDVARQYYELGRTVGGPKDAALEGRLK